MSSGRFGRTAGVALLVSAEVGLAACVPHGEKPPPRPAASTTAASTATAATFPEEARKQLLRAAAKSGQGPADGPTFLVERAGGADTPKLVWQAAGTEDLCLAQAFGPNDWSYSCRKAADIAAVTRPALAFAFGAPLNSDRSWTFTLLASYERGVALSCGTTTYPLHEVAEFSVGGVARYLYSVDLPRTAGTYRATVERDGEQLVEDFPLIGQSGDSAC